MVVVFDNVDVDVASPTDFEVLGWGGRGVPRVPCLSTVIAMMHGHECSVLVSLTLNATNMALLNNTRAMLACPSNNACVFACPASRQRPFLLNVLLVC